MNYKIVAKYLAYLVLVEAVFMLPSTAVGLIYGEYHAALCLLVTAGVCAVVGLALRLAGRGARASFYAREGFVVAGLGWLMVSLLGALPFVISGEIPNYFDAFFESASGFTTTGASVLANVEALSHAMLFWRSFTHWLGGIGVLAFILAVVRAGSSSGFGLHLLRAETPGPQVGKIAPKMRESARLLLLVYGALSAVNLALLLVGGMPLFDAFCTMFGTAGTGGFGIKNDSMASYSPYLQTVTTVFMALFGVNFALYYLVVRRQWRAALRDEELRLYVGIMLGAIALITISVAASGQLPWGQSLHHSAFTVSSIMTTTGFATVDFDLWPQFARAIILLLMVIGAMAGSTGGGFKIARILILFKSLRAGVHRLLHPHSVKTVRINGRTIDDEVLGRTYMYLLLYWVVILAVFTLLALQGLPIEENLSATLSCFNNIGPGLGLVGPTANYGIYSSAAKLLLTITMLLGRLEIFPLLLLATPATWRRKS
ncbi:MAG: TrkH family potassium uptake protein [Oscillospiraceae bacterium]